MAFSPYLATYDKLPANHRVLETLIASLAPSRMTYKYASRCKQSITALNSLPLELQIPRTVRPHLAKAREMLSKGGIEAWLVDEEGTEIKHGVATPNGSDSIAVVPIDARKKYAVHWRKSPGSPPASYWTDVTIYSPGGDMPIFYRKCAHHWMDKDDPKTQKRSSKRLIGKYKKIGLRSPSLSSPTIGSAVRVTFRRAMIYSSEVMDEDGYWTPRIDLVNSVHARPDITFRFHFEVQGLIAPRQFAHRGTGQSCGNVDSSPISQSSGRTCVAKRRSDGSSSSSCQPQTPESYRVSKRRRTTPPAPPAFETSDREDTECDLADPLTDDPERDISVFKEKLEATNEDLNVAAEENKKWKQLERYASQITDNVMKMERIKTDTEARKDRFAKLMKDGGVLMNM